MKKLLCLVFIVLCTSFCALSYAQTTIQPNKSKTALRWTSEKANEWYSHKGWLRGCNFIPSTAINQLEMWQAESFDTVTINRQLGWAQSIGLNVMRVFLHHLPWEVDPKGF